MTTLPPQAEEIGSGYEVWRRRLVGFFGRNPDIDSHTAEDLTQIVLEKLWHRDEAGYFEGPVHRTRWVFTVAKHELANYHREHTRQRTWVLSKLPGFDPASKPFESQVDEILDGRSLMEFL